MNKITSFKLVLRQNCLHPRRERKNKWIIKIQFSLSSRQKWSYITQQIAEQYGTLGINSNHVPSFASIYIPFLFFFELQVAKSQDRIYSYSLLDLAITPSYHPLLIAAFLQLSYSYENNVYKNNTNTYFIP